MTAEKARWDLYKDAASCFEQIQEICKTITVRPLTSHLVSHARKTNKILWARKNKLINDVLLSNIHGNTSVDWPAKTFDWSFLREHWVPAKKTCLERWPIVTDGVREDERNPCCPFTLTIMLMMMILERFTEFQLLFIFLLFSWFYRWILFLSVLLQFPFKTILMLFLEYLLHWSAL